MEKIKLEIGGGTKPRMKDFLVCDIRNLPTVDLVCKADNLPLENSTVEEIFSRHLIEHFSLKEFLKVLAEWNRVLKKDGKLYIICPNLLWHLKQILDSNHTTFYSKEKGKNDRYWGFGSLFGWQQNEYDIHKFGYYFELLRDILLDFGFDEIQNLTDTDNSFEKAPWHLEVKAVKKKDVVDYKKSKFYHYFDVTH